LFINNTDLESGVEYLPANVIEIWCPYDLRPDSKVKLLVKELEQASNFIPSDFMSKLYLKKKLSSEILKQIKDFNH